MRLSQDDRMTRQDKIKNKIKHKIKYKTDEVGNIVEFHYEGAKGSGILKMEDVCAFSS